MSISISIITINYNNLEGLKKTIKSITEQVWQDFEYIVIDGGSTDGSAAYIENQKDKIDYWISEKDTGIYNAINKGISKATGKYVVFMNSGDFFISSNTLKSCWKFIRNKEADVFYGQIIVDQNDKKKTIVYPKKLTLRYLQNMVINHQACFFKRTTLLENNGYDEKYNLASDYHYYLKLIISKKTFYPILFPIVNYDITGISSLRMAEYKAQMRQIWKETIPVSLIELEHDSFRLLPLIKKSIILKLVLKLRKHIIKLFNAN